MTVYEIPGTSIYGNQTEKKKVKNDFVLKVMLTEFRGSRRSEGILEKRGKHSNYIGESQKGCFWRGGVRYPLEVEGTISLSTENW